MKLWILLLLSSSTSWAADLQVTVAPLESSNGHLLWSLFQSAEQFPDHPFQSGSAVAQQGTMRIEIKGLTPGPYALTTFHDANDNGILDKNMFGQPTEMFGISNITQVLWSSPDWDEVKFDVQDGNTKAITILMKYQVEGM